MLFIPAIDLIGGQCVRLVKGEYGTAHKVAEDVLATAQRFAQSGAGYLHLVDLDGAKAKKPKNKEIILKCAQTLPIPCEVGGGVRTMEDIEGYLSGGVSRVILGSSALEDPALVKTAAARYGEQIAVGIDALDRLVRVNGWTQGSGEDFVTFGQRMEALGVGTLIFTDISRDGTLTGPNLEQLAELKEAVSCQITASGGVTTLADLKALKELGLYGAICGKALYTGEMPLLDAVALCQGTEGERC